MADARQPRHCILRRKQAKPAPGCRAVRSTRGSKPGHSQRRCRWARVQWVGSRTMCIAGSPTGLKPVGAATDGSQRLGHRDRLGSGGSFAIQGCVTSFRGRLCRICDRPSGLLVAGSDRGGGARKHSRRNRRVFVRGRRLADSFDSKPHSGRTHECKQRRQPGIAGPAQCPIQRLSRQSRRCRNVGDPPAGLGDSSKCVHNVAFVTARECFVEQRCDVRVIDEMFAQEVRVRPTACRSAWSNPPSTASHF
jgi:hypothetical protein